MLIIKKIPNILKSLVVSQKFSIKKMQAPKPVFKFYDIAANLTDQSFSGIYHGKSNHPCDRSQVIKRSQQIGCDHLLIAAGCIEDATLSFELCSQFQNCFATIGVHPCRAKEPFDIQKAQNVKDYFQKLQKQLVRIQGKVVAIGECGLDYDRLEYATKQQQLQVFPYHFQLAHKYNLPMYLHNRNTGNDFYQIVAKNRHMFPTGVVHSFTGTQQELQKILALDLYVGINGCSLKAQQNLQVAKKIPLDRLMLETDSPYCEIKNTHASMKYVKTKFAAKQKNKKKPQQLSKGRNQPCRIIQVLQALSGVMQMPAQKIALAAYENSIKMLTK